MKTHFITNIFFLLLFTVVGLTAKTIANIPEASGITYVPQSKSLFVVNDEGTLYEISKKGKIKRKKYLGKFDLEGIAYDKKNDRLLIALEGDESILILDRKTLQKEKIVKIKRKYKKIKLLKKSKKAGLEAIAIDEDGNIYVSNQSRITYKKKLKENASVVVKINSLKKKKAKITEVYNHGYIDIAGLTFHDGYLYMTSDKKNLLIKYDIQTNTTIKKIKLPKSAQEGICFDENGYVYIADDNGRVLRYKAKKLGI